MAYWEFYWKGKYLLLMFILVHKLLFFARVILQYSLLYNRTDFLIVGARTMPNYETFRFVPFRFANYSKPHVITIHEVWKGGPSWSTWRRLSLICQMGRRLFTNIFLPNYSLIFVHWPVQCNVSPRRVYHQSPTFRFFSWVELRTNKWPFHRSTTTGTVFQLIGLAYKRLNKRD